MATSGPWGSEAAERDSNLIVESQLNLRLEALEHAANADVLSYLGPMYQPAWDIHFGGVTTMGWGCRMRRTQHLVAGRAPLRSDG